MKSESYNRKKEIVRIVAWKVVACAVLIAMYYLVLVNVPALRKAGLAVGINTAALFMPLALFTVVLSAASIIDKVAEKVESHRLAEYLQVAGVVAKYASVAVLIETTYCVRHDLAPLAPLLESARSPALLVVLGLVLKDVGDLLLNVATPVLRGVGYFLVVLGARNALSQLPVVVLSIVEGLFYAGVAVLVLNLLGVLAFSKKRSLALFGRYCWEKAGTFSFIVFVAVLYLSLKSYIAVAEPLEKYLFLVESAAVITVILLVADGVYTHFNRVFVLRYVEEGWELHKSKVRLYGDPEFKDLEESIEKFVKEGAKEELLVALSYYLARTRAPPSEVRAILAPLLEYEEPLVPVLAPRWSKKRAVRSLMARRIEIVNKIHENINKLTKKT